MNRMIMSREGVDNVVRTYVYISYTVNYHFDLVVYFFICKSTAYCIHNPEESFAKKIIEILKYVFYYFQSFI